jgi:hypothetical protein
MSCACKRTCGVSREMAGVFSLTVFVRYVGAEQVVRTILAECYRRALSLSTI